MQISLQKKSPYGNSVQWPSNPHLFWFPCFFAIFLAFLCVLAFFANDFIWGFGRKRNPFLFSVLTCFFPTRARNGGLGHRPHIVDTDGIADAVCSPSERKFSWNSDFCTCGISREKCLATNFGPFGATLPGERGYVDICKANSTGDCKKDIHTEVLLTGISPSLGGGVSSQAGEIPMLTLKGISGHPEGPEHPEDVFCTN